MNLYVIITNSIILIQWLVVSENIVGTYAQVPTCVIHSRWKTMIKS